MNRKVFGLKLVMGMVALLASMAASAQAPEAGKYKEGIHYKAIQNAPLTSGDKVEVTEAFSYMCSHCAAFEPYISSWAKRKPENVVFTRIPVVFGRSSWEVYARAYVTAEIMGIADASHGALMDKIWKEKTAPRSIEELSQFYAAFGVDPVKFVATSKSFAVDAKIRKDQRTIETSGVQGTPSLIVNGKYLVAGNEAVPNYDVMLDVVDYLVAVESAAQAAAGQEETAVESASSAVQ
jgi:thiol:disulfide interchange protein DsbA